MDNCMEYEIGGHKLVLPHTHLAPKYQTQWQRYDTALGYIAEIVFSKYPQSTAIDIGANIGDSAALIQQNQTVLTLCIEGNPDFLPFLVQNAATIGDMILENCFVGDDGKSVALELINSKNGTASINAAIDQDGNNTVPMKSLRTILEQHPEFNATKLLKIDTDGCDFAIIDASIEFIQSSKPIIFFEYDILQREAAAAESVQSIQNLINAGYKRFVFYDNFGNYLASIKDENFDLIRDFNSYLFSNRFLSGTPAIYYYDVCAFPDTDLDLFTQLRDFERQITTP